MRPDLRLAGFVLLAGLALASCQKKKQAQVQATAGGEVLPGSASDAMLPIDTVRSQPPLAPRVEPSGKAPTGKAEAPGGPAEGEPAAEPSAEAPQAEATAAVPSTGQ